MTVAIYVNEDNKVKVIGLRDEEDNAYVNDATGTFRILDDTGTAMDMTEVIDLTYIAASNGNYVGYLPQADAVFLEEFGRYQLEVSMTSAGRFMYRIIPLMATYHGEE